MTEQTEIRPKKIPLVASMVLLAIAALLLTQFAVLAYDDDDDDNTGNFSRMFKHLPAYQPDDAALVALANAMRDPNLPENDNPDRTPSGFTYIGQFLDHDLTLDTTPLGDANIQIKNMVNNRTARLDLDSMYGGGPYVSPQLYDAQGHFKFSTPNGFEDMQRTPDGKAILVEGRNDENMVIAQIHIAFQKFHNKFIDQGMSFTEAQKQVQWHWQWVVVHDVLPHFVGQDVVDHYLTYNNKGKPKVDLEFFKPGSADHPRMPIEFSAAAYRFGHSMVRLAYVMPTGSTTKTQVFNVAGNDLHGSRPIPPNLKIDFHNFFDIPGDPVAPGLNISRKIDALISASLFNLPIGPVVPPDAPAVTSLAERNLLRGKRLGLPSYQAVAQAMGITPYSNFQLGITDPALGNDAPLWFGLLKESELGETGKRLGPTGGHIVAEVILGLIQKDQDSYFHASKAWKPMNGDFHIADLLRFAGALN